MSDSPVIALENAGIRFYYRSSSSFFRKKGKEFWALRGLDLSINKGDVLGIVGRNGAGKSTCARLLAGVYAPSEGKVIRNRTVNLLTLGTGFNPELSGRQNIYINGSYLGISKKRIKALEETIVDFAEIHNFIDEPIKVYSSGMRSRLAFSIASHMNPEILILDEILATGDRFFREKAEAKILEVINTAYAVVLISHQEAVLSKLCTRMLWLEHGHIKMVGEPSEVLNQYRSQGK